MAEMVVLVPGLGLGGLELELLARRLLGGYVSCEGERDILPLPAGREVGGIAGTFNFLVGWLLGVGRPNDTLVSVEEALHAGMRDARVLRVSHSCTLLSRTVARSVDLFLKTGRFPPSSETR